MFISGCLRARPTYSFNIIDKMIQIAVFAAVLALASACSPPTTDFHVESCQNGTVFDVHMDTVKMTPYPANPDVPVQLEYTYDNTGGQEYDKLKVDVSLSYYGSFFWKCGWHSVPIPIHNLDGCSIGKNCPIPQGKNLENKVTVDLTPFASIIKTLADNVYYRLQIKTKASDKSTVLNCLQADFLLK